MTNDADQSEAKREQIVLAAMAEFQENGFASASMDRISARAGASKRTVYRYFESKEKLFQTLIERHCSRLAACLAITYQKGRDIREQLTEIARAEGNLLTSPDTMATTRMVMSEILRNPELACETQSRIDLTASFEALLRDADADGQLRVEDPREAAEEFIGLIKAKAFWPVIFGAPLVDAQEMARIVDSSVEMMMCRYGRN